MTTQATIGTNANGTLLITDATEGITIKDADDYKIVIRQTDDGILLTVYDASQTPTNYKIEDGELKNTLTIIASVNGIPNTPLSDELETMNHYPKEREIVELAGNAYKAISAKTMLDDREYHINFNNIGKLTFEGQIAGTADTLLTDELVKIGRDNWHNDERITYVDETTKTVEVVAVITDTENGKYIVNTGIIS